MGFYIRKAVRVGPLRFNLSRSGIGLSGGVKGLRVGTGPRGNYIHMGRGGLYFRKSLNAYGRGGSGSPGFSPPPPSRDTSASVDMTEIESGSVLDMVDSSAADLLTELNEKRKRSSRWPLVAVPFGLLVLGLFSSAPPWGTAIVLLIGVILSAFAYHSDELRKTTVILYDLESEAMAAYQRFHDAFEALSSCGAVWHIAAQGAIQERKYHGGASTLVTRQSVFPTKAPLPLVKTNIEIPNLPAGRQTLAFLPDRLLVFDSEGIGAVGYQDLKIEIGQTRFVEDGRLPRDAKVVDQTWKYVNKDGGPDRRFRDNCELPVALYEGLHLVSPSGLNELLQISRLGIGETLVAAVNGLAQVQKQLSQAGDPPARPAPVIPDGA